eukprot:1190194-Karenia_brevis.AAC.1
METLAITRALLDRVDSFYSRLVVIMLGSKRRPDETLHEYIHRRRTDAKRVLVSTTGSAAFMLCVKTWNYYGHCLRNIGRPEIGALLHFRNDA